MMKEDMKELFAGLAGAFQAMPVKPVLHPKFCSSRKEQQWPHCKAAGVAHGFCKPVKVPCHNCGVIRRSLLNK
jgi:hypothetical protein